MKNKKIDVWEKCYPSNWKGMVVPDAIAHPAKYSSKLIRRIYEHVLEEGWTAEGDSVFDPFGGVALGALNAMRFGLRWRGIELETRFSQIGNQNIALWNSRYASMPHWCADSELINGDSRNLHDLLLGNCSTVISSLPTTEIGFSLALSSPHKADSIKPGTGSGFDYSKMKHKGGGNKTVGRENIAKGYGVTSGNLGSMPAGDFSVSISSPPFRQSTGGTGASSGIDAAVIKRHAAGNAGAQAYGASRGQLANMREGNLDAIINSQLLESSPEDFWSAARLIVEQTYLALAPGGHAVWVVKDFVKGGKIIPFCDQWRQLCEAVGFVTLHEHHALFTRHNGTSYKLEGGEVEHKKSSKSFFRRVAESHGSPPIDYETIFCMEKPA